MGVGRPLFTILINNATVPTHGFFDSSALYMDGELRKFIEQLVGLRVWTSQEATEGGTEKKSPRQDIYKKICPPDAISRRPPYDKSTKMLSLGGSVRFELNKPLTFTNVKADARDIIYRRSLVITTKSKFSPHRAYDALPIDLKESGYISPRGDTLEGFVESRPAASAFFNIIYRYVATRAISGSRGIIGDYARNEGNTWVQMREACLLSKVHAPRDLRRPTVDGLFD